LKNPFSKYSNILVLGHFTTYKNNVCKSFACQSLGQANKPAKKEDATCPLMIFSHL
jgi:hypothetical protein